MPLYFVNFNDGRTEMRDDVGTNMPDPEMARSEVMRMLAETVKFEVDHGSDLLLVVRPAQPLAPLSVASAYGSSAP